MFFISGAKRKSLWGHAIKNDRKTLKAYWHVDLYEDGKLFYRQGHLPGVDV